MNNLRQRAAFHAVDTYIQSGMVVGLGEGRTAQFALERIAEHLENGVLEDIIGIPTSQRVEKEATRLGIPVTTLEDIPNIDVTVDGADEVDPQLNLIKGGHGAMLREKIVAQASLREIIMIEENKMSPALGTNWAVPIEVLPFGWVTHMDFLESLGGTPTLRTQQDGSPFYTDNGGFVIDCNFGAIADIYTLDKDLNARVGILGHGLFINLATVVVVAGADSVWEMKRSS
ncbi:MAG: ribose 5-phosphate isomerase A [Anaerolineae bacterium]|nr:ribose 5-phosphate isomerase A [Anaerolineae bacterium]